ncbi:MAG: hypothetical protein JSU68_00510 [Phycisphaerales bacterium]|nr:MAG: hypothetical protein JSU68_00510 [Phycisphaerales bacterium]
MGVGGGHRKFSQPQAVIGAALLVVVLASSAHVIRVSIRSAEAVPDRIASRIDASRIAPQIAVAPISPQIDALPIAPQIDPFRIAPQVEAPPICPQIDASHILSQIGDELATATAVNWADGSSISFTVPDSDNDGVEETVDYRLTAGRLIRTCNGSSAALMDNADELRFEYRLSISDEQVSETVTEQSAELVLAHHDGYPGYDYYHAFLDISPGRQWAHQFEVTGLPEGTVSFTVAYVMVRAGKSYDSSTGPLILSMERPLSPAKGWPNGNVLDQATIDIGTMTTIPGWHRVTFSNLVDIPVHDNAFSLRVYGGTALDCSVWASFLDHPPGPDDGQQAYYTQDGGASWNPGSVDHSGDLRYFVYGTFNTAHTVEEIARVQRITGVQITLTPQGSELTVTRFAQLAREPACDQSLADLELGNVPDQPIVIEDSTDPLPMTPLAADPPEI